MSITTIHPNTTGIKAMYTMNNHNNI
jgi:hypothetical protein